MPTREVGPAMRLWPWLLSLALAGCGDDFGIERLRPDTPPETTLRSGPPDSTATDYRVRIQWSGSDREGPVNHFDVIIVDHPASRSHVGDDPGDDDSTRVVVTVPNVDDPRWRGTTASESTFVTLADTLRRDPRPGPGETPDDVRRALFDRWHTVFVRAVDDRGLPDPTPDYVTFNATNLAPTVRLLPPIQCGATAEFVGPPALVFNWDGEDPLDASTSIAPVASRYAVISTKVTLTGPGDNYVSFPESLYVLPGRYSWSSWRRWDADDGSGKRAFVYGLRRVGEAPGVGFYLFAVQAMDEAGAVTPVFDYQTCGKNNVARVRVSGNVGPLVVLHEPNVGSFAFTAGSGPAHVDITAGQTLAFHWSGDAAHYGAAIEASRYAWDLEDPSADSEWSEWRPGASASLLRVLEDGTHRLYVQVRDNVGLVGTAVLELTCYPVTRSRSVLWVDDTDFLTAVAEEDSEDARWRRILERLGHEAGFDFDPVQDSYDVHENRRVVPPIYKLLDYRVLVWSVRGSYGSALRNLAEFYDPYGRLGKVRNNYLFSYLVRGGSLWISGLAPAYHLWPPERAPGRLAYPLNVPHWDDPIAPHPQVDSVGTISLLYRMGIELVDVGAAIGGPREVREHFCYGFWRGDVEGAPELVVGPGWNQGGTGGVANIEIYNMPLGLASQVPPLQPQAGLTAVAYTYRSGVPEDVGRGMVYPRTADRQPVFVLAKEAVSDPLFSRAFCSFEPYLLVEESHFELTRFVLGAFQVIP